MEVSVNASTHTHREKEQVCAGSEASDIIHHQTVCSSFSHTPHRLTQPTKFRKPSLSWSAHVRCVGGGRSLMLSLQKLRER